MYTSCTPNPIKIQRAPAEASALKRALERTHIRLGGQDTTGHSQHKTKGEEEEEEEEGFSDSGDSEGGSGGMYAPASRLPDPTGQIEMYRGKLNAEVRARIRASSVIWGEEPLRCVCVFIHIYIWLGGLRFHVLMVLLYYTYTHVIAQVRDNAARLLPFPTHHHHQQQPQPNARGDRGAETRADGHALPPGGQHEQQ